MEIEIDNQFAAVTINYKLGSFESCITGLVKTGNVEHITVYTVTPDYSLICIAGFGEMNYCKSSEAPTLNPAPLNQRDENSMQHFPSNTH